MKLSATNNAVKQWIMKQNQKRTFSKFLTEARPKSRQQIHLQLYRVDCGFSSNFQQRTTATS